MLLPRAAVGPDADFDEVLGRINLWGAWNDQYLDVAGLHAGHAQAHRIVRSVMAGVASLDETPGPVGIRRPILGPIAVSDHLAQAVFHVHDRHGYQQLFAFDDVWADRHRHRHRHCDRYLASSMR